MRDERSAPFVEMLRFFGVAAFACRFHCLLAGVACMNSYNMQSLGEASPFLRGLPANIYWHGLLVRSCISFSLVGPQLEAIELFDLWAESFAIPESQ